MPSEIVRYNSLYYPKTLEEFEKRYNVLNVLSINSVPETYNGWICYKETYHPLWKIEFVKDPRHVRHRTNGPAVFTFNSMKNNTLIEVAYHHEDDFLLSLPCTIENYKRRLSDHCFKLNSLLASETMEYVLSL